MLSKLPQVNLAGEATEQHCLLDSHSEIVQIRSATWTIFLSQLGVCHAGHKSHDPA